MNETPPQILDVLLWVAPVALVWSTTEMMRRMYLSGSRGRFVMATVEHATRYPAGIYLVVSAFCEFRFGSMTWSAFQTVGFGLWCGILAEKRHHGEDDDFWTGFGDRMRKLLGPRFATDAM